MIETKEDAVVRRRIAPAIYLVDEAFAVVEAYGDDARWKVDSGRLPEPLERAVRDLVDDAREGRTGAATLLDDAVIRLVPPAGARAQLWCVLVERLRSAYDPREAVARFSLTAREAQVLHLLLEGASNAEIGSRLKIAETTAHDHVQSILKKTGVHRRSQIVAKVLGLRES